MRTADLDLFRETTLTYTHDSGRIIFRGVVDATNIEIFRDFLAMLPQAKDIGLS